MKGLLHLLVLFYLLIISGYNYSQILSIPTPNLNKCGSDEIHRQLMQTDAGYAQRMQAFENMVQSIQPSLNKTTGVVYKIPVVVHVMHKGEAVGTGVNVSDEAIRNAIKDLNEMYRKVPGSQGDGNGVDVEIEYSLAVRDPNGNCTNGINRVNMTGNAAYMSNGVNRQATGGISDATLKSTAVWNQNNYYNIWLVSEIDNNEGGSGIQGYAYFASSHGTSLDGAVILSSNFTSGTSTTAAHELGHSLNLYHTFEGDGTGATCPTNSNGCGSGVGDCCGDIPAHRRSSSDCVTGTNACDGVTSRDLFIHNYMDYSSDACQNMLTANQKTRMQAAITGARASFLSPENGGTCMSLVPVTTAGVNFTASSSILCGTGQSVTFTDISSCIPNSYIGLSSYSGITHSWTITNGTNTYTSSLQNPTITFTNTGTFNVTLSVTNAFGTTTLTKPGMIVVTSGPPVAACTPNSTNVGNYWQTIYNTTFNNINSSTSKYTNAAYTNLACTYNTTVTSGSTYSMAISANAEGGTGNEVFEVYIDYNNNGIFSNPSELVFSGVATSSTSATFTTNVTIPGTAVQNTLLRMRVIGETNTISVSERTCGINLFIGDVEDYGVYILSPPCTSPTITATTPSSRCGSGTLTLSATSNTGTVNWYTAATGGTAIATGTVFTTPTLTTTTTYYVDATNAGCTTPIRTAVTASINAIPIVTLTASSSSLCSGSSSTITATGASTYTWLPSGTGSVSVVSPTSTTVYSVTGTSSAGCVSTVKTITITVNSIPSITLAPLTSTICSGQTSALVASGASTYSWNTGATSNSISVTPTVTTSYTVVGTSAGCSSAPKIATVTVNSTPIVTLSTSANTICAGQSVTLTATGASTYSWLPTGSGTLTVVNPTVTTVYSVVGTSSLGCISSPKTQTIIVSSSPVVTITPVTSTICAGQSVTLTASGATSYSWSTGAVSSSVVVTPTTTSVYSVTGSTGSCFASIVSSTISVNSTPVLTISPTNTSSCLGQNVILIASGASTYTWSNGSNTSSISITPTVTSVFTVTGNSSGCSSAAKTATVTVNPIPTITLTASSSSICAGQTVSVTASGASTYTWLPAGSGTLSVASPTSTTVYTVTGTSASGCLSPAKTITINVVTPPVISLTPQSTTLCAGQSTTLSVSGAASYSWSTGATTSSVVVTPSVTSNYSVIGLNGTCSSNSLTANVTVNSVPSVSLTASSSSICAGQTVSITASGASTYTWLPAGSGTLSVVSPTSTTVYSVTGTSALGCLSSAKTITITVNPIASLSVSPMSATICSGQSVLFNASGATSYSWSNGATTSSVLVSPTLTTTYTVNSLSGGCGASPITVSVTVNSRPTTTATANGTLTCANLIVALNANIAGMNYTWTPPTGGSVGSANTQTTSVLSAGTYSLLVINPSTSCSYSTTVSVVQNTVSPTVTSSVSGTLTCAVNSVSVVASTTAAPVSYLWSGPGILSGSTTSTAVVNQPGTYNYTVTNTINGCKTSGSRVVIQNTTTPTVTVSPSQTITCSSPSVTLSGVSTPSNCLPTWSGGVVSGVNSFTATATNANIFTLTVTNPANGCSSSGTVQVLSNVSVPNILTSSSGSLTCSVNSVQVVATSSSSPVSYLWSGAGVLSGANSASATVNAAGVYSVTVTNTLTGCASNATVSVTQNTIAPIVSSAVIGTITCATSTALVRATTSVTPVNYSWAGVGIVSGATTGTIIVNQAGTYNYTVTNTANGCKTSGTRTVTQNTVAPNVIGSVSGTLTCSSLTTNVIATTTSSPVSYTWVGPGIITGASTGTIVVNQPGNYNYTVTSSNNGCKKVGVLTVIQNTIVPSYTNTSISNTICNGGSKILAVNTSSNNSIIWSNGSTSSSVSVTPSVTTVYTTTITSLANGCLATTSSTVNVVSNPVAIVTTTNVSCFGVCDGGASVSIIGGSAPYTYSLMTGTTQICQSTDCYSLCAGNYTVVTNDANGCSVSSSLSISQPQALVASATNSAASCSSCSDGNAFATVSGGTAPYTYVWTPSSATTPTLNNTSVGCYTVLITDSNGCQNSASTCVGFATGLSSATFDDQVISVYPNPSKAIFNITMTTQLEELHVEVYNAIGQVIILEDYKNANNISLDMTNVSRGVYYLKVSNNNGNKLFKLILE